MAGVAIELRGVSKLYPGGHVALEGVNLEIRAGEFLVLLGPSGSGKTTLLRLIAGLESPTSGSILFDGEDVTSSPPRLRDVAMAFQTPALYPHLNVEDNLTFGLRARGMGRRLAAARAEEASKSLGIRELFGRKPQTLSGGERQRVSLGRALARRPGVCLFDEPLASLDAPLRATIRRELVDSFAETSSTFVYVTHDQAEALALADRLVIVNQGRIVEAGSPRALYDRPGSRFVGEFLGSPPMNFLECRVIRESNGADWLWSAGPRPGKLAIPSSFVERLPAGPVLLGVRPEHVVLAESESPREPDHVWFQKGADLSGLEYLGHETVASLSLGSGWRARLPGGTRLTRKTPMAVGFHLDHARWFEFESGRAIPLDALADPANRG